MKVHYDKTLTRTQMWAIIKKAKEGKLATTAADHMREGVQEIAWQWTLQRRSGSDTTVVRSVSR